MRPDSLTHNLEVKVFYKSSLEPIPVGILWIEQVVVSDCAWSLIKQLGLLSIDCTVIESEFHRRDWALLAQRQSRFLHFDCWIDLLSIYKPLERPIRVTTLIQFIKVTSLRLWRLHGRCVAFRGEVDVVTPLPPPNCIDYEFLLIKHPEICLVEIGILVLLYLLVFLLRNFECPVVMLKH